MLSLMVLPTEKIKLNIRLDVFDVVFKCNLINLLKLIVLVAH